MNLGRLPELMDHLAGEATGITIVPIVKHTDVTFGGSSANYVDGWEIRFSTLEGSFAYRGRTISEAVADAWANSRTWR